MIIAEAQANLTYFMHDEYRMVQPNNAIYINLEESEVVINSPSLSLSPSPSLKSIAFVPYTPSLHV